MNAILDFVTRHREGNNQSQIPQNQTQIVDSIQQALGGLFSGSPYAQYNQTPYMQYQNPLGLMNQFQGQPNAYQNMFRGMLGGGYQQPPLFGNPLYTPYRPNQTSLLR